LLGKQSKALQELSEKGMNAVNERDYKNRDSKIDWVCDKGHIQKDTLKNIITRIKRGSYTCKQCHSEKEAT